MHFLLPLYPAPALSPSKHRNPGRGKEKREWNADRFYLCVQDKTVSINLSADHSFHAFSHPRPTFFPQQYPATSHFTQQKDIFLALCSFRVPCHSPHTHVIRMSSTISNSPYPNCILCPPPLSPRRSLSKNTARRSKKEKNVRNLIPCSAGGHIHICQAGRPAEMGKGIRTRRGASSEGGRYREGERGAE